MSGIRTMGKWKQCSSAGANTVEWGVKIAQRKSDGFLVKRSRV